MKVEKSLDERLLSQHQANISNDLPFRQWVYAWLLDPHIEGNYQKSIDKWIGFLRVAMLFVLILALLAAVFEQ